MEAKRKNQIVVVGGLILILFFLIPGEGICVRPKISNPILRSGDIFPSISFSNLFIDSSTCPYSDFG